MPPVHPWLAENPKELGLLMAPENRSLRWSGVNSVLREDN